LLHLHDLPQALRLHLKEDNNPKYLDALQMASSHAAPANFVITAVSINEVRLLRLAGELAIKQPTLLHKIDVAMPGWQAVWLAVARATKSLITGLLQPTTAIAMLFEQLVTGYPVNEELLVLVSTSEYADLRNHPNRAALWSLLPPEAKTNLVRTTARNLVLHAGAGPLNIATWEKELRTELAQPAFQQEIISTPQITLGRVLEVLQQVHTSEDILLHLLSHYRDVPTLPEAKKLGDFVQQQRWAKAAVAIMNLSQREAGWREALNNCFSLLDTFTQLRIITTGWLSRPDKVQIRTQWWQSLTKELKHIYYQGPWQDNLWQDSGGDNSIIRGSNGSEQWDNALSLLYNKSAQNTVAHLLITLVRKHPYNDNFRILQQTITHA